MIKKILGSSHNNVIDIFTRKKLNHTRHNKIIRLAADLDNTEMLYSNKENSNSICGIKIVCWALFENGKIDALVPWLDTIVPAQSLSDPLSGSWQGYYDQTHQCAFFEPPVYKVAELTAFIQEHPVFYLPKETVIQEIPDSIGTHALLLNKKQEKVTLAQIISWKLYADGCLLAMIADKNISNTTLFLVGDTGLSSAQSHPDFRYFFHYTIANKIKQGNKQAMQVINEIMSNKDDQE